MAQDNSLGPKYRITIHDIHTVDDEQSDTTMSVFGRMVPKDNVYTLTYLEQSGELEGYLTVVDYTEGGTVTISRHGPTVMEMTLEKKKRHNCVYDLEEGRLIMGVYTRAIESQMSRFGGTLELVYDIDFNADFVSENILQITVKEIF